MKIQTFGIELRRIDNVKALYADVDLVLAKSANVTSLTVAHSLHKMFQPDKWICVTTIRECADVAGLCIPREHMSIYSAVHCIHWNEMTPEYREILTAMILNDFRPVLCPVS